MQKVFRENTARTFGAVEAIHNPLKVQGNPCDAGSLYVNRKAMQNLREGELTHGPLTCPEGPTNANQEQLSS